MAVLVAQVFNMTYQESLQWQEKEKAFLDTLDLMPLLIKGKDLRDLKYEIEDLYEDKYTEEEFLFNNMDLDDLMAYLSNRYKIRFQEEISYKVYF